jgi:hypothetical protein
MTLDDMIDQCLALGEIYADAAEVRGRDMAWPQRPKDSRAVEDKCFSRFMEATDKLAAQGHQRTANMIRAEALSNATSRAGRALVEALKAQKDAA